MANWTVCESMPASNWRVTRGVYLAAAALAVAALLAGGCAESEGDLSGQAGGGLPMPDQIVGQAWQDANGDGNLNAGEPPAAGVEVLLSIDANGDGLCDALEDAVVATSMTDELGRYEFSTLDIGAYCVEIGPGQASAAGVAGVALDGTSGAQVEIPLQ